MTTAPIAFGLLGIDKLKGRADGNAEKHKQTFNRQYVEKAKAIVTRLMAAGGNMTDEEICRTAGITAAELRTQKHTKMPASRIGQLIGNRDHSTVIHSCNIIENRIKVDKAFADELESIETSLKLKV